MLSPELVKQLEKHNNDLELIQQERLKAIEELNKKYSQCLSQKDAKAWRDSNCDDYTKYPDMLKPELMEKLGQHKLELDRVEAEYLVKVEALKTKYNKCFKTQNVKSWADEGCDDYTKYSKDLGNILMDQLREDKGKLDELEKKRLAIIEKTNKQFAPCLKMKDLKTWNESTEKCNDFESLTKKMSEDTWSNS